MEKWEGQLGKGNPGRGILEGKSGKGNLGRGIWEGESGNGNPEEEHLGRTFWEEKSLEMLFEPRAKTGYSSSILYLAFFSFWMVHPLRGKNNTLSAIIVLGFGFNNSGVMSLTLYKITVTDQILVLSVVVQKVDVIEILYQAIDDSGEL